MPTVSLLTIVHGRRQHLHQLLRGVAAQQQKPEEVIIVFMNEDPAEELPDPGCKLYRHQLNDPDHDLPLAAARNLAAAHAKGDILAFLDVDCIPDPTYLETLTEAVDVTRGLVMGDVRYLPEGSTAGSWTFRDLAAAAVPHPRRPVVPAGRAFDSLRYELFWSLCFGLRSADFARQGGFDESYGGYGAEDTDFAFTARKAGLPAYVCPARVYHQFHPSYSPPYNHLEDIVENANHFYRKWDIWPMEGWLRRFTEEGYVSWDTDAVRVVKIPGPDVLTAVRSHTPYG